MTHPVPVFAQTDLVGLLILIIIVANIVSSIVQGLRRARSAQVPVPVGSRPSPAASPSPGGALRELDPASSAPARVPSTQRRSPVGSPRRTGQGAGGRRVRIGSAKGGPKTGWMPSADLPAESGSRITLPSAAEVFGLPPMAPGVPVLPGDAAASQKAAFFSLPGGQVSPAGLFVAAAIIGPCAALRAPGHTPGGW
jgi:hypothetical protein